MLVRIRRQVTIFGAVALVGCVPSLSGCAERNVDVPAAPATIAVGLLAATGGGASATGGGSAGGAAIKGAQLAVDLVNTAHPDLVLPLAAQAGLRRGSRLVLVTGDTGGAAATATQAVDQMINKSRPAGLVVVDSAEVVKAVGDRTERAPLVLIDAYTSADALGRLGRAWYFRTAPTDTALLSTALDAVRQGTDPSQRPADPASPRRLVVLDGASQVLGGASDLPDLAQSRGLAVEGRLPLTAGAADLADRIGVLKPDAVIALVGTAAEAGVVDDTAQRLKTAVPVVALGPGVGAVTGSNGRVLRVVGWSADYVGRNPGARAIDEMYRQRNGAPMNEVAASAFTAVLTLAAALDNVVATGAVDNLRVRSAVRQVDLRATETIMPWDGIRFDAAGQNSSAAGVVERRTGDDFRVVYPRELAARVGTS